MHEERVLDVPQVLRPWVSGVSAGRVAGTAATVLEPPDNTIGLVLRAAPGSPGQLVVTGPRTVALYSRGEPGPSCLTLRIRPGRARALLGRSARGLTDRAVPLDCPLGRELAGTTAAELLDRLVAALPDPSRRPDGDLVGAAAELLAAGAEPEQVQVAARRLHVAERHLRTLFTEGLGISPKRYARIDRLRTVLAHARDRPWRRLATDAGYYDQSHMTAEFRRLMGITLTAYVRGALPPAVGCHRTASQAGFDGR